MSTGHSKLETAIAQMELRIVEKITAAIDKLKWIRFGNILVV